MSDVERLFHETWLGMVQPIEGLVVSIPVLVDAQCMERLPPQVQQKALALCRATPADEDGTEGLAIADLGAFLSELLGLTPDLFDRGERLPPELELYVHEGRQTIRPTMALRKQGEVPSLPDSPDVTQAMRAGAAYELLVWELPDGLDLDRPETQTGPWDYPPSAKFDRLLRHCRVPVGLIVNGEAVRLVYAPHGESSGAITFRVDAMMSVGGRPILDALVMLLSANRFFGVAPERTLPAILAESRKRQANVTNDLAEQVFEALQILLRGFESAAERDGRDLLDEALAREGDHLYKGLLTVLLRLVFLLYAEDRSLLPVDQGVYAEHLSVLGLFERLQADHGAHPDSMSRRFGAWGRLVAIFRAVYLGVEHGALKMPPRRGTLFNPHEYPFLEGWGPAGSAPITQPEDRARVKLPTVDDETVFRVLGKLLVFQGQRLSYRALDVEQIGSVYEALMGYHVLRAPSPAVCMRPNRLWVSAEEVLEVGAARRGKWLKETVGLSASQSQKLGEAIGDSTDAGVVLEALAAFAAASKKTDPGLSRARAGQLVLQPGAERRRTSSHYTPRSLSAPIVRRTLEPLLAVMGDAPASERILHLKVCDPAMGSGAFLVEACRFLADHVLAAWTREGQLEAIAAEHGDALLHARRLVAQRCLYGVDKNDAAVELAKLSLWLVTLSKTLPFTFLDHCLRHGDSLVGLDFDQIRAFHWRRPEAKASPQLELFGREIAVALDEAIALRQKIGELGDSPVDDREKARLFWDAQDALDRVRLIGDLVVGAFFAHEKDKEREAERGRREERVRAWLGAGGPAPEDLVGMQREIRARLPVFHWMVEFPEVFYAERPDPLDQERINSAAYMDAFVGNPPFMATNALTSTYGQEMFQWLLAAMPGDTGVRGKCDLSAFFFRRCSDLLGEHGALGFIATNTIAQGDTRSIGLQHLVQYERVRLFSVESSMPWPGAAAVVVAVVHLAKGAAALAAGQAMLDGHPADHINSRLLAGPEAHDPVLLGSNRELSSKGVDLYGPGFVIEASERDALISSDARNTERIFPFLGGAEVNSSPTQSPSRYVINFATMSEAEAARWPELLAIVRERVKPGRDSLPAKSSTYDRARRCWWQFFYNAPTLYEQLAHMKRCLVTARVTKHLCFSFQPTDRLFNEKLYVFPIDTWSAFALLQSRIHSVWTWRLSSTMKTDLNYSATECFGTFPFAVADAKFVCPSFEDIGQRLYDFRAAYMLDENVGLTITYNRLKDPSWTEPRILELRRLHEEMDRKVVEAYAGGDPEGRWLELEVPPFCPMNDEDAGKLKAFEDGVIDRLFALNARRAEEERVGGDGGGKAGAKKTATGAAPAKKKRASRKGGEGQLDLVDDDQSPR